MHVVAAGVVHRHLVTVGRSGGRGARVVHAGVFPDGQCVQFGAQQHGGPAAIGQDAGHSGAADASASFACRLKVTPGLFPVSTIALRGGRSRPGDTLASALVWVTPRGRRPGGRTRLGRAARRLPAGPAGVCPRAGNPPSPLPAGRLIDPTSSPDERSAIIRWTPAPSRRCRCTPSASHASTSDRCDGAPGGKDVRSPAATSALTAAASCGPNSRNSSRFATILTSGKGLTAEQPTRNPDDRARD